MALTNSQLEERILLIEEKLNEMQVAINNMATKAQLKQFTHIRQTEVDDLKARVTDLESQIAVLQAG
jgi:polyhydroxyalkanoate synthesis regulator phasin